VPVKGRLLALDPGAKRVGLAVSDELRITVKPLPFIERRSWKKLLERIASLVEAYDARALVIGLPLSLDGSEQTAAQEARALAEKFRRSLPIPVYLQDERLTTAEAWSEIKARGLSAEQGKRQVDSAAAAVILRDFIEHSGSNQ
jgi:putative holliday junction resolvase